MWFTWILCQISDNCILGSNKIQPEVRPELLYPQQWGKLKLYKDRMKYVTRVAKCKRYIYEIKSREESSNRWAKKQVFVILHANKEVFMEERKRESFNMCWANRFERLTILLPHTSPYLNLIEITILDLGPLWKNFWVCPFVRSCARYI